MDRVGRVELVRGEICIVRGIEGVGLGNVVVFSSGAKGLVLGFKKTDAEIAMLSTNNSIKKGDLVRVSSERMMVDVGNALLGRVINPMGEPIDGKGAIEIPNNSQVAMEAMARPIYQREIIKRPFQTGYLTIDSQIPLGLGQRELLLGERNSGQNDLAIDIICNQARMKTGLLCIYVGIDADAAAAKRRIERLTEKGAMENSVVIIGRTSEAASINYIAPMVGTAIAEWFSAQGKDVLIIYDNLTHHAKVYRQISLLLERPASREAYPGDIFYLHSRLLERSGSFNASAGGGTITALPIVETQSEDATDYITTNLMSITDGHVLFRQSLANKGDQPPIDSGFSVSRIGGQAQLPLVRSLSEKVKGILIRYEEVAKFMSFGTDLASESLASYDLGLFTHIIFQQSHDTYYNAIEECALMQLVVSEKIRRWNEDQIVTVAEQFVKFVRSEPYVNILNASLVTMSYDNAAAALNDCVDAFIKHPDTLKPIEKHDRLVAEIETVSDLLQENDGILK